MAARAIWKGNLKLGRTDIPVKLYSAVEDRGVHFHLLEKRTHERVRQHMVDASSGEEVAKEEIKKGYQIEPNTFVIVTDEELNRLEPDASRDIQVESFLPTGRIPPPFYERPYYLGPDGDAKSYFALAEALEKNDREGFVQWVMRGKEYNGALRSRDGYLFLITLRHSEEVLSARELPAPPGKAPDPREIRMAEQLVGSLEGEFNPEEFRDDYRDRVMQFITAKAKGRKPKLAAMPKRRTEPAPLLDMLAASLKPAKGKKVA